VADAANGTGSETVLEARGVRKSYGSVEALRGVDFSVYRGETIALVGDNGAGKSTLIKVLCGAHSPDEGELLVAGEPVRFAGPREARLQGISVVYQDLALVENFDIAQNVFLGRVPVRFGRVDRRRMARETTAVLEELAVNLPSVRTPVRFLSGGQRQAVAIARAVHQGGRVLIMDEPTAALGVREGGKVLQLIETLKSRDLAIIVVSHNLEHVFTIADRIAVLRAGRIAGTREKATSSHADIVGLIMGAGTEATVEAPT
jgi:ABC-type sugar transport system ATPase subunit